MNTIGSHPGAILFRMSVMVILITIITVVFFHYIDKVQQNAERAAIMRTKGLIESALVVVFVTYVVEARLDELNDLAGANPFDSLHEFVSLPGTYAGEVDSGLSDQHGPGWYYLKRHHQVVYRARHLGDDFRFELKLNYIDANESGRFESEIDRFQNIHFIRVAPNPTKSSP